MTAYIGHNNLFESATSTTASNEVTGFEKENAYDWKLFDFWKPGVVGTQTLKATFAAGVDCDYFAFYGHNLGGEGVTAKLQSSTAGSGGPWTTRATSTPTDNEVVLIKFTSVNAQDWQIELTNCTVDAKIAVIAFGEITELPAGIDTGFTPATFQPYESDINISQSGLPLGNSIKRKPIAFNLNQSYVSEADTRNILVPIFQHLEATPGAFFSWDYANHSDEALYIYPQKKQAMPNHSHHNLLKTVLKLYGIRD